MRAHQSPGTDESGRGSSSRAARLELRRAVVLRSTSASVSPASPGGGGSSASTSPSVTYCSGMSSRPRRISSQEELRKAIDCTSVDESAELRKAEFRRAELRNAELRRAELRSAELRRAELRSAAPWRVSTAPRTFVGSIEDSGIRRRPAASLTGEI